MPQMAPLWWFSLFNMFIIMYFMYIMIMYFFSIYQMKTNMNNQHKLSKNINWKW